MSAPTFASWARAKRIGRYLIDTIDYELLLPSVTSEPLVLRLISDSDYAQDRVSRKSISCGIIQLGGPTQAGALLHGHARQQSIVATSSAEAEFYAMGSVTAEGLGVAAALTEMGISFRIELCCDSSSARALATRSGLGRSKHVDVKLLWLQGLTLRKVLEVRAIPTATNPADIGTKALDGNRLADLAALVRLQAPEDADISLLELVTNDEIAVRTVARTQLALEAASWSQSLWWLMQLLVLALMVAFCQCKLCAWTRPQVSAKKTRTVSTQSMVTYTSTRHACHPRFQVLSQSEQGVWTETRA
jgi:hypothetical protein